MVLKLDLEKAYDRLEWSFIESSLERFGLPLQLRSVISACISTASMSINWNGSNTDQFSSTRGLRQGDPISPYLFVLSLERLGHKIQQAVHEGSCKALPFGRQGPKISHLFFANDLVLVAEASMDQVGVIRDILDEFCAASGQKVNLGKSQVFFSDNVGAVQGTRLSGLLGIAETKDLGRYLGVPLLHHRASKQHYSFLLDRMRKKLTSWKASTLSFDGRVTLAQSSLSNIPGYTMQTCSIPMAVCEEAERICRDFIWGSSPTRRKCHLISWEKLCKPKNAGGLGFRSLCTLNMAHMMKLGWQVVANPEKLWVQAMRSKYRCGSQTMPDMVIRSRSSHAWRAIIQAWPNVVDHLSWVVKDGNMVRFWRDPWIPGMRAVEDSFPNSVPANEANFPVSFYANEMGWKWEILEQLLPPHLCSKIAAIRPPSPEGKDSVFWALSSDGIFSLKSAYTRLSSSTGLFEDDPLFAKIWSWRGPQRVRGFSGNSPMGGYLPMRSEGVEGFVR